MVPTPDDTPPFDGVSDDVLAGIPIKCQGRARRPLEAGVPPGIGNYLTAAAAKGGGIEVGSVDATAGEDAIAMSVTEASADGSTSRASASRAASPGGRPARTKRRMCSRRVRSTAEKRRWAPARCSLGPKPVSAIPCPQRGRRVA